MDCSPPGSSVHGIFQARVLEWGAITFSEEYTEELYKKDLHDPDNHDGMITHLEPDILECQVKWALGPILWSPDVKSQLTGKDPDAGKD